MTINFSYLPAQEKAALVYAVSTRTQKDVAQTYSTTQHLLRKAKTDLVSRGLLFFDWALTPAAAELIPGYIWKESCESFEARAEALEQENLQLLDERSEAEQRARTMQVEMRQMVDASKNSDAILDLLQRLKPMGVNIHWVRTAAVFILVEAAMKKKLAEWSVPEQRRGFDDLCQVFEQHLLEREGRNLKRRLLSLASLRGLRNAMVHEGHHFGEMSQTEADGYVMSITELIAEILGQTIDLR